MGADPNDKGESTARLISAAGSIGFTSVALFLFYFVPLIGNLYGEMGVTLPLPTRFMISLSSLVRCGGAISPFLFPFLLIPLVAILARGTYHGVIACGISRESLLFRVFLLVILMIIIVAGMFIAMMFDQYLSILYWGVRK